MANEHARGVRAHESKNLFYVAMTRARDLVVTSATIGQRPDGWYKELAPMIGNAIPAIPYSALSAAAQTAVLSPLTRPSLQQLAAALGSLPRPPEAPALQRIPATRLAKEQDELDPAEPVDDGRIQSMEHATALGSLGHAVLEQLCLNGWEGSVSDWLERLREDFFISGKDAYAMAESIEHTRALMIELTGNMQEVRAEFPFVLHEGTHLIDGTIDLLCRSAEGYVIFDYKFTGANDSAVTEQYRRQMEIYSKAARHHYPDAAKQEAKLIVVSNGKARVVSVKF
ncbi:MAG: hypothetical protein HKP10_04980 [Kiritimatiellales bacterium]|nr:hypothetical protein [Kiritimatiellales bacterium]